MTLPLSQSVRYKLRSYSSSQQTQSSYSQATTGGSPTQSNIPSQNSTSSTPCCSCSKNSQCKTNRCACFLAKKLCTDCIAFRSHCTNQAPAAANPNDNPPRANRYPAYDKNIIPPNSDLPNYDPTEADLCLDLVYGDHVHQNSGEHLDGGIPDDALWQNYYRTLIQYHPNHYEVPTRYAKRFVSTLASLLHGIITRAHNSEKFLLFPMVILQKTKHVKRHRDVTKLVSHQLDCWDNQQYQMLVQQT